MTNLGSKFQCSECDTKYYDLGRDKALCPQCGNEMKKEDPLKAKAAARKKPAPKPQPKVAAKKKPKVAAKKKADAEEE